MKSRAGNCFLFLISSADCSVSSLPLFIEWLPERGRGLGVGGQQEEEDHQAPPYPTGTGLRLLWGMVTASVKSRITNLGFFNTMRQPDMRKCNKIVHSCLLDMDLGSGRLPLSDFSSLSGPRIPCRQGMGVLVLTEETFITSGSAFRLGSAQLLHQHWWC